MLVMSKDALPALSAGVVLPLSCSQPSRAADGQEAASPGYTDQQRSILHKACVGCERPSTGSAGGGA